MGVWLCMGLVMGGSPVCRAQWATEPTQLLNRLELITIYAKQLEQYRVQLLQYQIQLQNARMPNAYVWDQANVTINSLLHTIDTIERYKQQSGNLNAYLNQFQDANYYRNSPCFGPQGCTQQQWAALQRAPIAGSQSQKWANDALVKGIQSQEIQLRQDADNLVQLQGAAQSAVGHMEAIQAANQLASNQAAQLLQIRTLLLQHQNAIAAKLQADADKEARAQVADERALSGNVNTTDNSSWSVSGRQ